MDRYTYEDRVKIYTDAINTFGVTNQMIVSLEEMAEAQKEICKALRGKCRPIKLAEEVADAVIVLEQIRIMFGISDELLSLNMDTKMDRLQADIDKAKAENLRASARIAEMFGRFKDKAVE